jgi:hypothetical protein
MCCMFERLSFKIQPRYARMDAGLYWIGIGSRDIVNPILKACH